MTFSLAEPTPSSPPEDRPPARRWPAVAGYLLMFLILPVGFALGGEASSFASTGIMYIPFVLLALLAYLGLRNDAAKILAVLWWLGLLGLAAVGVVSFTLLASGAIDPTAPGNVAGLEGLDFGQVGGVLGISALGLLLGIAALLPPVRRRLSRVLPLDPDSFVHGIALALVVSLSLILLAPLIVTGLPPLLSDAFMQMAESSGALDAQSNLLSTVYVLVWTVPLAIFAVGYGVRRDFAASLRRLGFVRPTLQQVAVGVAVAVVLVFAASYLDKGIGLLWEVLGWPRTDGEAFSKLIAFAFTPIGAVVLGISAGLGEELGVRGVLQPRLGIVLSNLLFASLHALQYGWDGVLVVFVLGAVFGVLRNRTNTTTSAIAHGLYDFLLVMMAIYEISI
ncbi:MAG: CPBP family intramembrane metalloprotease [Caldilineaceae bacterium]|nr:CPBP family intramembrane metalloprotease [Caldilineaceae bacterium]